MERNLDIIREILIEIESACPGEEGKSLEQLVNEYGKEKIDYHVTLLEEAGYILGIDMTSIKDIYNNYYIQRLTWEGHEFLDAAKDNKIWKKAKREMEKLGSIPIEIVKSLLISILKIELGL